MAQDSSQQKRKRPWRSTTVLLAAVPLLCLALAACSSPFKGEPEPPHEQSGWELGHSNADYPTQEEMDNQDDVPLAP
jgi:hypothetical protein